ncbi:MFS transporter [Qipengyuania pacifica]|uniref:MFS transporter n=1 Tax=Qipengyuania pacifica TaxID=2860199 RepID=UPI0031EFB901
MRATLETQGPPTIALATAAYGALVGSLFPVVTVLSLSDVSGGLGVSLDSAALVNTMQNVGAVAGLLIAPTLAFGLGRGRIMALSGAGFALASLACAISPNLPWMLFARLLQGFFGGILPFMLMLLVMTTMRPGIQRFSWLIVFAGTTSILFGAAASVGGFLVDHLGWRSLFWVQTLLTVPYVGAAMRALPKERGNPALVRTADWTTWSLLSVGLGMVLFAVSEGERHFWFESWWVPALIVGGLVASAQGLLGLRNASRPIFDLSVFRTPSFTWAIILSIFFRFGQMFVLLIVPQFLARLQGFRAAEVGNVLLVMVPATGLALAVGHYWLRRYDGRWLMSVGLACFSVAAWQCVGLNSQWAAQQLWRPALISGLGMGFFSVAVLQFAIFGANIQTGPTIGVFFNLARVFGIVAGSSTLSHLLVEREKLHSAEMGVALGVTDPQVADRLISTANGFARFASDPAGVQASSLASLARAASQQAFALAFSDALTITALTLSLGALLVWVLPPIPSEAKTSATRVSA